jgi:predicted phage terminase large subunit-like protein
VDRLVIEAKASGQSVGQELYRMFRGSGQMGIDLVDPKMYGDKVARVHAIQHLFADKMIYAPDKAWADMVINQCAIFPRGSHDDLVDSTSQALRYLRDTGFALRRSEHRMDIEDEMKYRSSTAPLYPV